jgi:hypothetical protein
MGVDTHMIAGVRACLTFTPDRSSPAIQTTPHYAEALGYSHRVPETDVYDSHLYEQDPNVFAKRMSGLAKGRPYRNTLPDGRPMSLPYRGQPYFCGEFGGVWWDPDALPSASGSDDTASWGYGERPENEEEVYERFAGLVGVCSWTIHGCSGTATLSSPTLSKSTMDCIASTDPPSSTSNECARPRHVWQPMS